MLQNSLATWYQTITPNAAGESYLWQFSQSEIWFYIQRAGGLAGAASAMLQKFAKILWRSLPTGAVVGVGFLFRFASRKNVPETGFNDSPEMFPKRLAFR